MQQKTQQVTHTLQKQRKQQVINICKQIKYIVQGNLKQHNIPKTVKQDIIPLLIQIFIENYHKSQEQSSLLIAKKNIKNQKQVQIFRDKINTFLEEDNKQNQKTSFISIKDKSNFKTKLKNEEKQNQLNDQSTINRQLQKKLAKFNLSLKIFLICYNKIFNNARDSLYELKSFGDKKNELLDNIFHLQKKMINRTFFLKLVQNNQFYQTKIQKNKLRKALNQDFCLKLNKLVKERFNQIFQEFRQNCLSENKWTSIWIKKSTVNSPICLQVSFWRMKNYFKNQNLKLQKVKQGCVKIIKSIEGRQSLFFQKIKHFISTNTQGQSQKLKQNQQQKQEQEQSSDQSLSSRQFQEMFQNQEESLLLQNKQNNNTKEDKDKNQQQQFFYNHKQHPNQEQQQFLDQFQLEPISQEDTQKTINSVTSQKNL